MNGFHQYALGEPSVNDTIAMGWTEAARNIELGRVVFDPETQRKYVTAQIDANVNATYIEFVSADIYPNVRATPRASSLWGGLKFKKEAGFRLCANDITQRERLERLVPQNENVLSQTELREMPKVGATVTTASGRRDEVRGSAIIKARDGAPIRQIYAGGWLDITDQVLKVRFG